MARQLVARIGGTRMPARQADVRVAIQPAFQPAMTTTTMPTVSGASVQAGVPSRYTVPSIPACMTNHHETVTAAVATAAAPSRATRTMPVPASSATRNGTGKNGSAVSLTRKPRPNSTPDASASGVEPRSMARRATTRNAEGQRGRGKVEAGGPRVGGEEREGEHDDGRESACRGPDAPAQRAGERDGDGGGDRVEHVPDGEPVDAQQALRERHRQGPDRRVVGERDAEHGDEPAAVEDVEAEADVLRLVRGRVVRREEDDREHPEGRESDDDSQHSLELLAVVHGAGSYHGAPSLDRRLRPSTV